MFVGCAQSSHKSSVVVEARVQEVIYQSLDTSDSKVIALPTATLLVRLPRDLAGSILTVALNREPTAGAETLFRVGAILRFSIPAETKIHEEMSEFDLHDVIVSGDRRTGSGR